MHALRRRVRVWLPHSAEARRILEVGVATHRALDPFEGREQGLELLLQIEGVDGVQVRGRVRGKSSRQRSSASK
jgi:hypothetical protein